MTYGLAWRVQPHCLNWPKLSEFSVTLVLDSGNPERTQGKPSTQGTPERLPSAYPLAGLLITGFMRSTGANPPPSSKHARRRQIDSGIYALVISTFKDTGTQSQAHSEQVP